MSTYQNWAAKQRGRPLWLILGTIGLITSGYYGYTKVWAPFIKRRKLARAEIYANYVYEQENKRKDL